MRKLLRWRSAGALLAAGLFSLACSDASPTGPEAAIPSFGVQQIGACAEWSCAIADCREDPAIYGACCVAIVDNGQEPAPRPSCGFDTYCARYPERCQTPPPGGSLSPAPDYCYHTDARDVCSDLTYTGDCPQPEPNTWDQFPECFPS